MSEDSRSRLGRGLAALMAGAVENRTPQRVRHNRRIQAAIARRVGKSRTHVTNTLRLLKLPEPVQAYIVAGKISAGAARMLVSAADPEEMAREIVDRGLNVREVEALAKDRAQHGGKRPKKRGLKNADTLALERRISDL